MYATLTYDDVPRCAYKFTGKERDAETGLDHSLFRKYASTMGRWLSPDPLGGKIVNPQSLNRYSYVLNNPLRSTDPLGLMYCKVTKGKDGKEQTSDCVSDDDYNKDKDKYPDHTKIVRQEEVTVSADGKSSQSPAWHSYTTFIAGVPRRLNTGGAYINSQAYINAISQSFDAFPKVTGIGGFLYGGYEFELPYGGEIELVGLAEYDSQDGLSGGLLFAAGGKYFQIGLAGQSTGNGLRLDAPMYFVGSSYGGLVQTDGVSLRITAIGAYAGRFSPVPNTNRKLGGGGGAYLSIR